MEHYKEITEELASLALEYSKENWARVQEYGTAGQSDHEIASATTFAELLKSKLTEDEIGYILALRGCTYPAEELI